jgi:hypothetical protein
LVAGRCFRGRSKGDRGGLLGLFIAVMAWGGG